MKTIAALVLAACTLFVAPAASAQRRATSVPHTTETSERPGLDRLNAMLENVREVPCTDGTVVAFAGRIVHCIRTTTIVTETPHGHHARRTRHHHRHGHHAQPVNEETMVAAAMARPTVTDEASNLWDRLGQIRATLEGINGTDPRVETLLANARTILVELGYNVTIPADTTPTTTVMTADATPVFPR